MVDPRQRFEDLLARVACEAVLASSESIPASITSLLNELQAQIQQSEWPARPALAEAVAEALACSERQTLSTARCSKRLPPMPSSSTIQHASARRAERRLRPVNLHQTVRLCVWQRPEQNTADHREDQSVGADARRQRDQGDQRERPARGERANAVSNVLNQIIEPSS